jgi:hypothetical protein
VTDAGKADLKKALPGLAIADRNGSFRGRDKKEAEVGRR